MEVNYIVYNRIGGMLGGRYIRNKKVHEKVTKYEKSTEGFQRARGKTFDPYEIKKQIR